MPAKVSDKRGNVPITIPSSSCIIRSRRQQVVCCVNPEWPRRRALDHLARMLKGVPSPICWSHEWRGRPGCRSPPTRTKAVHGQFLLLRPVIMRGRLACGHRVSPHGRTVSFVSWRWHPEQREGWSGNYFCVSYKVMPAYPEDHTLATHVKGKASSFRRSSCRSVHVSEPYNKMDSIQVWYRRSFVCSWSRVCCQTLFVECMAVEAMPIAPDNVWLTPARSRLNRPQLCKFSYPSSEWPQTGGQGVDSPRAIDFLIYGSGFTRTQVLDLRLLPRYRPM